MVLFGADGVFRHLQQLEYKWSVGTENKTYLLDRVIDAACMGPNRQTVPNRSQAEALECTTLWCCLHPPQTVSQTEEFN